MTSPDGQYRNQIMFFGARDGGKSIQSTKISPRADCGSDNELLIEKFRLTLKQVGKTTRSFRYDLNQHSYNYTVEVMKRFKGLNLVDRVPEELWTEVCNTVQEMVTRTFPMGKKNARRQSDCLRRPYKQLRKEEKQKAKEKGKIYPSECRVPDNRRRDKKAS